MRSSWFARAPAGSAPHEDGSPTAPWTPTPPRPLARGMGGGRVRRPRATPCSSPDRAPTSTPGPCCSGPVDPRRRLHHIHRAPGTRAATSCGARSDRRDPPLSNLGSLVMAARSWWASCCCPTWGFETDRTVPAWPTRGSRSRRRRRSTWCGRWRSPSARHRSRVANRTRSAHGRAACRSGNRMWHVDGEWPSWPPRSSHRGRIATTDTARLRSATVVEEIVVYLPPFFAAGSSLAVRQQRLRHVDAAQPPRDAGEGPLLLGAVPPWR